MPESIALSKMHSDNISYKTGKFLRFLVELRKPKKILEIGTGTGYSTKWLASKNDKVVTIEKDKKRIKVAKKRLSKYKNIEILEGDAVEILKKLKKRFDFVFIDARKREYITYIKLVKLNKNALVVADNVISHKEKVRDYLRYVRKNFKSVLVPIGKGLEVSLCCT